MTTRQDRDQRFLDDGALPEDHRRDSSTGRRKAVERLFGGSNDGGFDGGRRGFG